MTRKGTGAESPDPMTQPAITTRTACTLAVTLTICAALVAPVRVNASGAARIAAAPEATSATLTPTLSPNRPGAKGALTLAIQYTGGEDGVPSPVHRSVLSLPAGLTLEVPSLRSCSAARLRADRPQRLPTAVAGWTWTRVGEGVRGIERDRRGSHAVGLHRAPAGQQPDARAARRRHDAGTGAGGDHRHRRPRSRSLRRTARDPDSPDPLAAVGVGNLARQPDAHDRHQRAAPPRAGPTRCWCPHPVPPAGGRLPRRSPTPTAPAPAPSPRIHARRRSSVAPRSAKAASIVSLHETGNLRLTSKHGFTLNEQGSATGTFSGTIHVRLTILSSSRVRAEVSISRSGGSISGEATAIYHRSSASASFSGSLSVNSGTGRYSHARGSGLSFGGTIQNSNDAIAVHLSGPISA